MFPYRKRKKRWETPNTLGWTHPHTRYSEEFPVLPRKRVYPRTRVYPIEYMLGGVITWSQPNPAGGYATIFAGMGFGKRNTGSLREKISKTLGNEVFALTTGRCCYDTIPGSGFSQENCSDTDEDSCVNGLMGVFTPGITCSSGNCQPITGLQGNLAQVKAGYYPPAGPGVKAAGDAIDGGGCSPPYCMGTGTGCGCNCKCCPPKPCYTSWTYTYLCGTPSSNWVDGGDNEGCVCTSPGFAAPSLAVDFPDFDYPVATANDNGFVFALSSSSCSIPCDTMTFTLQTSGCCLYGSGFSFIAVGKGRVSVSGDKAACGSNFTITVNGSDTADVADCGSVTVEITPPSTDCCSCCLVSSVGTLANPPSSFTYSSRNVTTGVVKKYIDKQALIDRIKKSGRASWRLQ